MEQPFLRCPTCGQIDAVQKVNTIVKSGTSHGTGASYGLGARRDGCIVTHSQTELSRNLAFPEHHYGCVSALGGVSFFLAPFSFLVIAFESSVSNGTVSGETGQQAINSMAHLAITVFFIFISLGIGSLVSVIAMKIKRAPKRREALALWNRLFYCQRDDTIFVPGDSRQTSNASSLHTMLRY